MVRSFTCSLSPPSASTASSLPDVQPAVPPGVARAPVRAAARDAPLLYVLVVTAFSINRFFLAGLSAALPHVVERNKLVLANAVTPTSGTIAFIVGLGLGAGVRQVLPSGYLDVDVAVVVVAGATYL